MVVFVALAAGPGPAALASVLTLLSLLYPLLSRGLPFVLPSDEILRLGLFVVASVLVVVLSAAGNRTSASLRLLRDNQQIMIRELQDQNDSLCVENAERSEAATKAQIAEQEIRQTVDTVPALIARYRPDGFMDFRNKNWREYTGLSQDNFGGSRWGSALHPDDEEMVEREWREHIATGEPFELEQRLRKADGEYRWHRVRRVPLHGETGAVIKWYAIAFDIDDRKRTEDALRRSEADLAKARHELQLIIDTVPVLVLRHRADGIIDYVNEVGRTYSGLKATKWTTRTSIITHPDDVPRLEAAWDVALVTGESFESEVRLRRADGEYRWFVTRRVPLRRDGEVIAWYAATYDIEDRKQAERELIESERDSARPRWSWRMRAAWSPWGSSRPRSHTRSTNLSLPCSRMLKPHCAGSPVNRRIWKRPSRRSSVLSTTANGPPILSAVFVISPGRRRCGRNAWKSTKQYWRLLD
jgi:PAS domain S-box-containing protein